MNKLIGRISPDVSSFSVTTDPSFLDSFVFPSFPAIMSPISSSQGLAFATAMAGVSATVILLSFCLQKSVSSNLRLSGDGRFSQQPSSPALRPCISSGTEKKKKKEKKRVHFAEDSVPSPTRNQKKDGNRGMPANRAALYGGIMKVRVANRLAYSC